MSELTLSVVDAFLGSRFARGVRPELEVHPDDEMLEFALDARAGERDSALAEYLWNGRWIADTLLAQLEARFGSRRGDGRVLDFACGYGRLSRWLVAELGRDRLAASDILAPAVEFQRRRFGIEAFASSSRPEALRCPERFDLVWVGSLFTHLPAPAFHAWLGRLTQLLTERGMLAFTTLDMVLSPEGRDVGGEGHRFAPVSESRTLDPAEYGTAWVTERFVAAAVEGLGGGWRFRRLPRGVCDYQDLVLVATAASESLDRQPFDPGPVGFVDSAQVEPGRRLVVRGWAWDAAHGRPVAAVELAVSGVVATAERLTPRGADDLASFAPPAAPVAFRLELGLEAWRRPGLQPAWIAVRGQGGGEKLLFLGTVAELLRAGVARERDAWRQRAERAEARAELFAASGFGRGHRAWLRAKRALGRLPADFPEQLLDPPARG